MTTAHRASLILLVVLGTVWALILGLGGAWLLGAGPATLGSSAERIARAGGATASVAGLLVFLTCVADRVCPGVSRRLVLCAEIPLCVLLVIGSGWVVVSLV